MNNKRPNAGGRLVQIAKQVHDEEKDWIYYTQHYLKGSSLIYWNIENVDKYKSTCCATYVSEVIYKAGYFTEEEMNEINYNYPIAVAIKLEQSGWQKIKNKEELQEGDIVFMLLPDDNIDANYNHVQIYAGNNKWYNAGSTEYIQMEEAYEDTEWEKACINWSAYRPPELKTKEVKSAESTNVELD